MLDKNKEMSDLEIKSYIIKLKLRGYEPELTEHQEELYNLFTNDVSGLFKKPKDRKEFLIRELESDLEIRKYFRKLEYCKKNGHLSKDNGDISSGQGGTRAWDNCSRCGLMYERNLTEKEWENFDKMMNAPMTI